jgi:hypothetical protein
MFVIHAAGCSDAILAGTVRLQKGYKEKEKTEKIDKKSVKKYWLHSEGPSYI